MEYMEKGPVLSKKFFKIEESTIRRLSNFKAKKYFRDFFTGA